MYGGMRALLLVVSSTMSTSLTIIVNLLGFINCLKSRADVYRVFLEFQVHVERLLNHKIICMQTDWGGEYEKFNSFFRQLGIEHHVSCPHIHQQNSSAERKHRHVVDVGLTLLAHASMPLRFWDEAFLTACFLINRLPTRTINNTTPLERLFGKAPDYNFLRTFGSACWPCLRPYNERKLQFRSKRCVFLGYSMMHKGYRCLHVSFGRVYISRDVIFDENTFPFSNDTPKQTLDQLLDQILVFSPEAMEHTDLDNQHAEISTETSPTYL